MIAGYNPRDWYWRRSDGSLYASARQAEIDPEDDTYLTWVASGGKATAYPTDEAGTESEAELAAVLAQHGLLLWPQTLPDIKASLCAEIDRLAEAQRQRWITPGTGQAMTYLTKVDEARAIATESTPDPTAYPLLAAEVGITAPTLVEVGAVVLAAHQSWLGVGAAIEATRLGAKAAVAAAPTAAAAASAAAVAWPEA